MHGGDIYRNHVEIDFSVSVNPLPIPQEVRAALISAIEHCASYPDIAQERLRGAVAKELHVNEDSLLFGNGASELFPAALHALKPERVLVPAPAYSGYERAARAAGAQIRYYELSRENDFRIGEDFLEAIDEGVDLIFLTNPNNPVGNCIDAGLLERILGRCRAKDISVVLDECFIEFTDHGEVRSYARRLGEFPKLLIVRAFTKFFALPGVRLGYLLTGNKDYRERIALQLPEWNVSIFAQEAGVAVVREREYYSGTVALIRAEREYLSQELGEMGIRVYPSDANFIMLYTEERIWDRLLEKGIMIRDLSDFRGLSTGYYRIGVREHADNERLVAAMREIMA